MDSTWASSILFFFLLFWVGIGGTNEGERSVYIVYMGSVPPNAPASNDDHLQLLASVVKREPEKVILRRYTNGFSGFAARLSKEEAMAMAKNPGVVSVFPDQIFQLHTTRSWDFLQLQTSMETEPNPTAHNSPSSKTTDTIIGLLDTGVWPELESFNDRDMDPIPARWKGTCVQADDFNASNCNRKLIGARSYDASSSRPIRPTLAQSPRDKLGHGTHTASTAAGSPVQGVSYYGLATGTAKGGSTSSRIAMYKVCKSIGCPGSAILAGFDDAIADGVNIISVSLGASSFARPDFATDPIAIGAFHAVAKGITVVCSAGNEGPDAGTVVNAAPWILTVAATTIDRDFESDVVLGGNNKAVKGEAINFSNLDKSAIYPLIYGGSAKSNSNFSDESARNCDSTALDKDKIKGNIVLCMHSQDYGLSKDEKADGLKSLGARGMGLVDDQGRAVASPYVSFPVTAVSSQGGDEILAYIKSTKNPVATILPTVSLTKYKPAPAVAYFSSRGPSSQTRNILKPDVAAPGVNILAAWPPLNDTSVVPPGQKPTSFNLLSGTSMSCPHVSGIAASIKSWNPNWSPSAIRSAIMTTAIQTNNDKSPLTTDTGSMATPYDFGAGEVNPSAVLQPGLVYEAETQDYLQFLCNYGYNTTTIKLISPLPDGFKCLEKSTADLIYNLNYPSIAVSNFNGKNRTVIRTVTNVGEDEETTYIASVKSPKGLDVKVIPGKLQFTKNGNKLGYQVTFSSSSGADTPKDDLSGFITWSNGKHSVKSIYVLSN